MGLLSHYSAMVMRQESHHAQGRDMHIFITGGTGRIGSAFVAKLLGSGHPVLALARSDSSAAALETAGAEPLRGDLADLPALRAGAARADGVIHLAFNGEFSPPAALAQGSPRRAPRLGPWARSSSTATVLSSRSRPRRSCRAASPPRLIRCRPTDPSGVATARICRCWSWPRAASGARPYACRARCTTRARADSPAR